MNNLSRLYNKSRNGSKYLSNSTIRMDLKNTTLCKRIVPLATKFYNKLLDLPNEIVVYLPHYDAFKPQHRKCSRYALIMFIDAWGHLPLPSYIFIKEKKGSKNCPLFLKYKRLCRNCCFTCSALFRGKFNIWKQPFTCVLLHSCPMSLKTTTYIHILFVAFGFE